MPSHAYPAFKPRLHPRVARNQRATLAHLRGSTTAARRDLETQDMTTTFESLNLHEALTRALVAANYTEPTSVQAEAIPAALAGKDLMVSSRTGSGKTASFILPALTLVLKGRAQAQEQQRLPPHRALKQAIKPTPTAARKARPLRASAATLTTPRASTASPPAPVCWCCAPPASWPCKWPKPPWTMAVMCRT
jgi:DEAD/DEAH box helicase